MIVNFGVVMGIFFIKGMLFLFISVGFLNFLLMGLFVGIIVNI